MKRCNEPAQLLCENGFRLCQKCAESLSVERLKAASPIFSDAPFGPCDRPTESRAEFFRRAKGQPGDWCCQ